MTGYNFTDRVRKVLQMAREEAARLHHDYVGTEHILLGLLREGEGVAVAVLTNLNVDLTEVRKTIEGLLRKGKPTASAGPDLPYTSRAKKVLEYSMSEARELDHAYVGTEHLLLGLLREEKGIVAQVLTEVGADLELVRAELRLLGTKEFRPPGPRQPPHREGLSNAYAFTPELRRSFQGAREAANRLGSDHVDAVHIALAVLSMKGGAAVALLTALGVDSVALRGNLEAKLISREAGESGNRDLPFTSQARNVLDLAMAEAHELRDRNVTSAHLLLALLREGVLELPNAPLSHVRNHVAAQSVNRAIQDASRASKFRFSVRSSTVRLLGGILFTLSGAEALWYAPGVFGKAIGLLGAFGGLLMIASWLAAVR